MCTSYTLDLFTGVRHLHYHLITDRDIKPSNLLLTHAVSGSSLTVCDWGWSRQMQRGGVHDRIQNGLPGTTPGVCSEPHRPPEVWAGTGYNLRVDVWPAGTIAAELYTADSLWTKEWNVRRMTMRQLSFWLSELPHCTNPSVELPALADRLAVERQHFTNEG